MTASKVQRPLAPPSWSASYRPYPVHAVVNDVADDRGAEQRQAPGKPNIMHLVGFAFFGLRPSHTFSA
jgi:hypothetical protein